MKTAKTFLFLIIGGVVFTGVLWFFQRGTTSQQTVKVYKTTPVPNPSEGQLPTGIPSQTDSYTHAPGIPHSHGEDVSHTHTYERPSDSMIRIAKERLNENPHSRVEKRWLAFLESEEGRAFFDRFPSADAWFEKSKSFGFFEDSPELQAARQRLYRKHFPTGTADENEYIIREIMRDAILEHEHHKEAEYSRHRNSSVLMELLHKNDKYGTWIPEKFGSQPPSSYKWIDSTFEEIRLAEREKYLGTENNETPSRLNDSTGPRRTEAEIELQPDTGQTPLNTRPLSEDIRSGDTNTQQTSVEPLVPTVPGSPESRTHKTLETELRSQFSPERFNRAINTLNQYGPEEGLRRLKDSDPEVAKQMERLLPKRHGED